jgi:HEAT repeat protein
VINLLKDDDRYVRFMAAKTLGQVAANSPKRAETLAPVGLALGDPDADVRLAAAESVLSLGESEKAAALLITVLFSTDPLSSRTCSADHPSNIEPRFPRLVASPRGSRQGQAESRAGP